MLARVAMPAVRQKRSKLAPTSCQASSMVATGTTAADLVGSFIAFLSFVDSAPRAYRLKVGNACPPISTSNGTSPSINVGIGQPGDNNTRARFAAAGDQLVRLNRDRDAIMRVEATTRQLGGNLTHRGFNHFALRCHGSSSSPQI